jgi:hypothetical protein
MFSDYMDLACRARETKERLGHLKACNFDEYLKLVQNTKSKRIHEILFKVLRFV